MLDRYGDATAVSGELTDILFVVLALGLAAVLGALCGVLYARVSAARKDAAASGRSGPSYGGGKPPRMPRSADERAAAPEPGRSGAGWGAYAVARRKPGRLLSRSPPAPPPPPVYEEADEYEDDADAAPAFHPTQMMSFQEAMSRHLPMAPGAVDPEFPALPAPRVDAPTPRPLEDATPTGASDRANEPLVAAATAPWAAVPSPADRPASVPDSQTAAPETPGMEGPPDADADTAGPADAVNLPPVLHLGTAQVVEPRDARDESVAPASLRPTLPADPTLPPLEQPEVEWRDVDAHLKIWLRAARATSAGDGALAASPIDRTLRVVGIGIEDSERVILASDGPLCETEAIALRDIDRSIDLDSGEPIADLWQWLKTRDPSPDGPIH